MGIKKVTVKFSEVLFDWDSLHLLAFAIFKIIGREYVDWDIVELNSKKMIPILTWATDPDSNSWEIWVINFLWCCGSSLTFFGLSWPHTFSTSRLRSFIHWWWATGVKKYFGFVAGRFPWVPASLAYYFILVNNYIKVSAINFIVFPINSFCLSPNWPALPLPAIFAPCSGIPPAQPATRTLSLIFCVARWPPDRGPH